jgi:hypothetical protein
MGGSNPTALMELLLSCIARHLGTTLDTLLAVRNSHVESRFNGAASAVK